MVSRARSALMTNKMRGQLKGKYRPSIHQSSSLLAGHLTRINDLYAQHAELLRSAHAYPLASFPGYTQEGLLNQLLRKKLEPGVENWIERGLEGGQAGSGAMQNGQSPAKGDDSRDLAIHALRSAAKAQERFQDEGLWNSDFTIAEIEAGGEEMARIQAGFKRKLVGRADQESEEDEDEDEEMGDAGEGADEAMPSTKDKEREKGFDTTKTPLPLETMLKFISCGELPPGYRGG